MVTERQKLQYAMNEAKRRTANHELRRLINTGCHYTEGTDAKVPASEVYGSYFWPIVRDAVLERDKNTCQMCGSTNRPEVHHIKERHDGGSDHPYNLITLCIYCHDKVHHRFKTEYREVELHSGSGKNVNIFYAASGDVNSSLYGRQVYVELSVAKRCSIDLSVRQLRDLLENCYYFYPETRGISDATEKIEKTYCAECKKECEPDKYFTENEDNYGVEPICESCWRSR